MTAANLTALSAALWLGCVLPAQADVSISTKSTKNMSCTAGVCAPTAKNAVLNVSDTETMLAEANLEIKSSRKAKDILIDAPLTWSSANNLTLDAFHSITVQKSVSVAGAGALALVTNDGDSGGMLSFGLKGNVSFETTSNAFSINGISYVLANSIAALASAIASNPSGSFAFANSYDATQDGVYATSPISGLFAGTFSGLGNTITHLQIDDPTQHENVGFFEQIDEAGLVEHVRLTKEKIEVAPKSDGGGLAGFNLGTLFENSAQASVRTNKGIVGNLGVLAGGNAGTVERCHTSGSVRASIRGTAGGLVGFSGNGTISESFADVSITGGKNDQVGGLVGFSSRTVIMNSYASGSAFGAAGAYVGGLVGANGDTSGDGGTIASSYSTTAVSGDAGSTLGGLVGVDNTTAGSLTDTYWDLDTSGISDPSQGAGNVANDPGITGLSDSDLKSGLPSGFDPAIWAETSNINNGYPYLVANPQRR